MRAPPPTRRPDPPHRGPSPRWRRSSCWSLVGVAALRSVQPPAGAGRRRARRPSSAPAGRFEQVQAIATEPHRGRQRGQRPGPRASGHHPARPRPAPEVQDTVSVQGGELSSSAGGIGLARVRNVVTRDPRAPPRPAGSSWSRTTTRCRPGRAATTTRPASPPILETARALATGPRLRNDVVLVLTDAEEACLCGAEAFVDQHPLARDGGVVLNIEARGSTRSGDHVRDRRPDNAKLIDVVRAGARSRWAPRSRSRSTGCCPTTPTSRRSARPASPG